MRRAVRRLLLIPAIVLVLLGAPALALDAAPDRPPETGAVALPGLDAAAQGERAVADTPADLVGVKWSGDPDAEFRIEVLREGSDEWQPAGTLGGDDSGPDAGSADARASEQAVDGANVSEPVAVEDSTSVRVTVVSGSVTDVSVETVNSRDGSAPTGSAGAVGLSYPSSPDRYAYAIALVLAGVVLGAVALGWTPWRSRRQIALFAVLTLVTLAACVPPPPPSPNGTQPQQPAITMRSSWGSDLHWNPSPECAPGPEYAGDVNFLVVHHTVNSNTYGPSESRSWVRNIWAYHVNTRGYCDIAYNFIIDKYGQIFEGRQGGIDRAVIAAHTGGFNRESSGVALLGRFDPRAEEPNPQVTTSAWNSMVDLLAWKLSVHKKNPADGFSATSAGFGARWPEGTTVSFPNRITGHRDLWPTECPGANMYSRLQELQNAVQPKVGWEGPVATTTTSTPTSSTPTTSTTVAPAP